MTRATTLRARTPDSCVCRLLGAFGTPAPLGLGAWPRTLRADRLVPSGEVGKDGTDASSADRRALPNRRPRASSPNAAGGAGGSYSWAIGTQQTARWTHVSRLMSRLGLAWHRHLLIDACKTRQEGHWRLSRSDGGIRGCPWYRCQAQAAGRTRQGAQSIPRVLGAGTRPPPEKGWVGHSPPYPNIAPESQRQMPRHGRAPPPAPEGASPPVV